MNHSIRDRIQVFDPKQDVAIVERRLPHWSQAGTVCFITWRAWDSMPEKVIHKWRAERNDWLHRNGIDPFSRYWEAALAKLPASKQREFHSFIVDRWNDHLDALHGACFLKRPELASIVADSLRHLDGIRYDLTDFVVMPNHVHVLAAFPDEKSMLAQCDSWKHFTATKINRVLRRSGRLWQQDGFDHLVRSVEQFEYLRFYLADNPKRACLSEGEYVHESKVL
jgi:type I restriction enzyme R subunit